MSVSRQVTATFEAVTPTFLLSATKSGTGTGLVSSAPAGISCGSTCSAAFAAGQVVQLTATPDAGWKLTGWSGACSGTGACSVTMSQNQGVGATFEPAGNPGELTLSQGRVVVTLTWRNPYNDQRGVGTAVKQMDQYGYFWFDDASNPEVFVKILDTGEPAYQVYHSSLGTFEYTVNFKVVRTGIIYPFNRPAYSVCGAADATTVKK